MLYIRTNKDAKNFRVVKAPLATPDQKHWKEIIRADRDVLVNNVEVFQDFMVASEKTAALARLRIYDFKKKSWKTIKFDDPVYLAMGASTPEYTSTSYRLSYQSPVTPPTTLDVDMGSGKQTVLKRKEVVGGYDVVAMRASACGPPRATASRCRCGPCTRRASSSTALRRCCCTRTVRTGCRPKRRSRSITSACSNGA
ncbi:hypothetical protein LP420_21780 [Massilia sp. B-10]|nr:hypothetical protein LP420_21780 [Massilia sp. B-10]